MPFNVTQAAAHVRRIVLKFNQEKLEIRYNAGEKYRAYQLKAQQLDQEFTELNRRLQAETVSDEDYDALRQAMASARRRLADNICTVIESWDLEDDLDTRLDAIHKEHGDKVFLAEVENLKELDHPHTETRSVLIAGKKKEEDEVQVPVFGVGTVPVAGLWLDILPLPDEFILKISEGITNDFDTGGAGGKAASRPS